MTFALVFVVLTLVVLVCGLVLMARGGKLNQKYANKLMVMRVVIQAIAVAIISIVCLMQSTSHSSLSTHNVYYAVLQSYCSR